MSKLPLYLAHAFHWARKRGGPREALFSLANFYRNDAGISEGFLLIEKWVTLPLGGMVML